MRFTTAAGRTCCESNNIDNLCDHCRAAAEADIIPNPYASALRAAEAGPEGAWKRERLAALAAEHAAIEAHIAANPSPRLTAAELGPYIAPDGYRIALDAMRKEAR